MKPELRTTFAQVLVALMLAGNAGAAEQVVTPTPLQRAAAPDTPVAFTVGYTTANPCADSLTGLGLRIHWDSRQLGLASLTGVRQGALVARGPVELDTADADADPATDTFVLVAWADIDGAWPGGGCAGVNLYTANFRTRAGFTGSTQIRFSASSTAAGRALGAVAAVVELDTDSDGIPDATDPDDDNDGVLDAADSAPLDASNTGPVIALPLNSVQTALHGWGWGDNAYRTILAATFTGDGTDRLLHVQGYDVDGIDELAVWFNGKRLGSLTPTATNALGIRGLWWLPASRQVAGQNRIEIRQKTAGETWGVTRLGLYAPGAAFGNLKTLVGGDITHGAGFELHVPKTTAGYLLGVTGYDSDTGDTAGDEIRISLNGKALVDLPRGPDAGWTPGYQLLLPGTWLVAGDNRLLIKNRGLATEDWGLRLDGLRAFGDNLGQLTSIPATLQLPDKVSFLLAPGTTASVLDYRCYDADTASEIQRALDGTAAGACPATANNAWGANQRRSLGADARHVFVLDNTLNPPGTETWAVRLVAWLVDTDADGRPDITDNCPALANPDQADLDGDKAGDACDGDIDGDGHLNAEDAFPRDKTEWLDSDGDAIGNNADLDDDNDGFPDGMDPFPLDASKVPPASIGVHSTGNFLLDADGDLATSTGDTNVAFGLSTDIAITGDWNGDGRDEIGCYRPGNRRFYLDFDGNGVWNMGDRVSAAVGAAGDLPVIGDWDGNGIDDIGTYRPTTRTFTLDLDGSLSPTAGDLPTAPFLSFSGLPVAGDWNGDGRDEVGVWRPSTWRFYLDYNGSRTWNTGDKSPLFGQAGDLPVVGDWNGDGKDEIGVYRPSEGRFYLDSDRSFTPTAADKTSEVFGQSTDKPLSGRW